MSVQRFHEAGWLLASLMCSVAACSSDSADPTTAESETPAAAGGGGSTAGAAAPVTGSRDGESAASSTSPAANSGTSNSTPKVPPAEFLAQAGDGWQTLLIGDWELAPGEESYTCARFTLPQDVTFSATRALSPIGTHHTLLTVLEPEKITDADGVSDCEASTNGQRNIAGSGVGTNDVVMPKGVAVQLKAGHQLLQNLHLFNSSDAPLRGTSGTLVKLMAEAQIEHFAEGILAGTVSLELPPGKRTTQHGTCTVQDDVKMFAASAHMHQLGVHLKAVAHSAVMGDVVLTDRPYSFDEQLIYLLDEQVQMKPGDTIDVDCTYMNTTDRVVSFGESSLTEMCFAGLYWYPATNRPFICVR